MSHNAILYLIPTSLGENAGILSIPPLISDIINSLNHFIVENERTARRYLKAIGFNKPINEINFYLLDEHTNQADFHLLIKPLINGISMGLLSESGCPCIADPGAQLVDIAHQNNFKVMPLPGPSSIILALMASGFNGQNFAFIGYLPVKNPQRINAIKELEDIAYLKNQTQIFIEAPYRNLQLFFDILKTCNKHTKLCIATDLTLPSESVNVMTIQQWAKIKPDINKKPTVFLIYK